MLKMIKFSSCLSGRFLFSLTTVCALGAFASCGGSDSDSDDIGTSKAEEIKEDTTSVEISDGDLKGTKVEFAPGTIAIGATVEVGSTEKPETLSAASGGDASAAISFSSKDKDGNTVESTDTPMTLQIPVNTTALVDQTEDNLCVVMDPEGSGSPGVWRRQGFVGIADNIITLRSKFFGVFIAVYCGNEELAGFQEYNQAGKEGNGKAGAPIVSPTDVQAPANITALDKDKFLAALKENESDVQANSPEDDPNDPFTKAFNSLVLSATSEKMTIDATLDLSKGLTDQLKNENPEATVGASAAIRIYMEFYCPGFDTSVYNGKKATELFEDENPCNGNATLKHLSNFEMILDFSLKFAEGEFKMTSTEISMEGTPAGGACTWNVSNQIHSSTEDGCHYVEVGNQTTPEGSTVNYGKFEYKNISRNQKGLWYLGGTIEATINNWKGTLTYSGADAAPTYDNWTDGTTTVSGKWADLPKPNDGSGLVHPFKRALTHQQERFQKISGQIRSKIP